MESEDSAASGVQLNPLFNTFHELQELCQIECTVQALNVILSFDAIDNTKI